MEAPFLSFITVYSTDVHLPLLSPLPLIIIIIIARRVGSDGSMSACGSAGPWFNPRRGSKF